MVRMFSNRLVETNCLPSLNARFKEKVLDPVEIKFLLNFLNRKIKNETGIRNILDGSIAKIFTLEIE